MTEQEIRDCVRLWQRRLHLQDWEIEVNLESEPVLGDHAVAECERSGSYLEARIRFAANWREWTRDACQLPVNDDNLPPKSLDRIVVHELLHVLMHDLYNAGRVAVVDRIHEAEIDHQLERVVERLARVLVETHVVSEPVELPIRAVS